MRDVLDCACPRLDDFLTRWYGKPDRDARPIREADQRLPRPLQECFEVMTRWSRPLTVQNRLLDADQMWVDDGKQVFWVENQGVWLWGIDPVGADPAVYDRENEPGQPWEPTGVPLSVFLVQIAVFEAIAAAEYGAGAAWIKPEDLEKVLAPLTSIPGAKWRFPETMHQLYVGDDLLAQAGPNVGAGETPETAEYREVFVAGRIPTPSPTFRRSRTSNGTGTPGLPEGVRDVRWSPFRGHSRSQRLDAPAKRDRRRQRPLRPGDDSPGRRADRGRSVRHQGDLQPLELPA